MKNYKKFNNLLEVELKSIQGGGPWIPWPTLGELLGRGIAHLESRPVPAKSCYDYHSAYPAPVLPCK